MEAYKSRCHDDDCSSVIDFAVVIDLISNGKAVKPTKTTRIRSLDSAIYLYLRRKICRHIEFYHSTLEVVGEQAVGWTQALDNAPTKSERIGFASRKHVESHNSA